MRKYKTPKTILQHTRKFLADPTNYVQGGLSVCLRPMSDNDLAFVDPRRPYADAPLIDHVLENEKCVYCVLGAVRHFSADLPEDHTALEAVILQTPAGKFVEQAARELYPDADFPADANPEFWDSEDSQAVRVNDGLVHKTPYGAYRAVLRILDRAIELAS